MLPPEKLEKFFSGPTVIFLLVLALVLFALAVVLFTMSTFRGLLSPGVGPV